MGEEGVGRMALVDAKQKVLDVALMMEVLREQLEASTGDSIGAPVMLNHGDVDIAIIWTGGLRHVRKSEAPDLYGKETMMR